MKTAFAFCVAILLGCISVPAAPLTGNGVVDVKDGDYNSAYDSALREAQKQVLKAALQMQGDQPGLGKLLNHPENYLSDQVIQSSGATGTDQFSVQLTAVVDAEQLRAAATEAGIDLGSGVHSSDSDTRKIIPGERPTVMVFVKERYDTTATAPPVVAGLLQTWLTTGQGLDDNGETLGFVCVDPEQLKTSMVQQQAAVALAGDAKAVKALGAKLQAGWLLLGDASVTTSPGIEGQNIKPRNSSLTLRLVQADTGGVIANAQGLGMIPHIDEVMGGQLALERATDKAIPALAAGINHYLAGSHPLSGRMVIQVLGVLPSDSDGLDEREAIVAAVQTIPMVKRATVRQLQFSNGMLEIELHTKNIKSEQLATSVSQLKIGSGRLFLLEEEPRALLMQFRGNAPTAGTVATSKSVAQADELLGEYFKRQNAPVDHEELRQSDQKLVANMKALAQQLNGNDQIRREMAATSKQVEQVEDEYFHAEEVRKQVEQQAKEAQAKLLDLKFRYKQEVAQLGEAQAANSGLATELHSHEQTVSTLVANVSAARNQAAQLQTQLGGLRARARLYSNRS